MVMYTQKKENLNLTGKKINYNLYNLRETVGENQMCWILRHILVGVSVFLMLLLQTHCTLSNNIVCNN